MQPDVGLDTVSWLGRAARQFHVQSAVIQAVPVQHMQPLICTELIVHVAVCSGASAALLAC